jgi:hypothetical protein|tara:strand:- start:65 stop:364 length:300 start_codon:yes stop_codon:yes gene_type:complete
MKYNILDAEGGNVINTIIADTEFVEANFDHYELYVAPTPAAPTAEEAARLWRNLELEATDKAAQTPDWPNRDNILTYRTALRDWPSTSDFPDTRPTLGS